MLFVVGGVEGFFVGFCESFWRRSREAIALVVGGVEQLLGKAIIANTLHFIMYLCNPSFKIHDN